MIDREFRLSRSAREQHALDDALFSIRGDLITADLRAIRRFAADSRVDAGDLFALGLIHEIQHLAIQAYQQASEPSPLPRALGRLAKQGRVEPIRIGGAAHWQATRAGVG